MLRLRCHTTEKVGIKRRGPDYAPILDASESSSATAYRQPHAYTRGDLVIGGSEGTMKRPKIGKQKTQVEGFRVGLEAPRDSIIILVHYSDAGHRDQGAGFVEALYLNGYSGNPAVGEVFLPHLEELDIPAHVEGINR